MIADSSLLYYKIIALSLAIESKQDKNNSNNKQVKPMRPGETIQREQHLLPVLEQVQGHIRPMAHQNWWFQWITNKRVKLNYDFCKTAFTFNWTLVAKRFLLDPLLHVLGKKEKYPSGMGAIWLRLQDGGRHDSCRRHSEANSPSKTLVFLHFKFVAEYCYINTDRKLKTMNILNSFNSSEIQISI